jgi:DNA (cytosine-5)-methyltransferase 1
MLYQEIIFLQHFADKKTKWVVENVIPYYEPLIQANQRGRHLYWSNFNIPNFQCRKIQICQGIGEVNNLSEFHDYDFRKYKGEQRINKIARNLVDYEAGLSILKAALNIIEKSKTKQIELF